jgi:perosamine synthetase
MDRLMTLAAKHRLAVVEDCAQAPGVKVGGRYVGTIGSAGVFSFQQSKNIMTGEGGMVVTDDPEIACKVRLILNHGETVLDERHSDDEIANVIGCNFRMTELTAAVGRAQLPKLRMVNEWRMANYHTLVTALADLSWLTPPYIPAGVDYVCHALAFLYDAKKAGCPRDVFAAAIRAEGIPVGTGYVRPMYESPTFLRRIALGTHGWPWTAGATPSPVTYRKGQCPVAESLLAEQFIWVYHVAHPSTKEDMLDVAAGFHKVAAHLPQIAARAAEFQGTKLAARSQGRIL